MRNESSKKVVIQHHPSTDVTTFRVNRILNDDRKGIYYDPNTGPRLVCQRDPNVCPPVKPFVKLLLERLGKVSRGVSLFPGSDLTVYKPYGSDSDEKFERDVLNIIAEVFGHNVDELDVQIDDSQLIEAQRRMKERQEWLWNNNWMKIRAEAMYYAKFFVYDLT